MHLVVDGFPGHFRTVLVHIQTFSLISSLHIVQVDTESICVRANTKNARCKFYCGQDTVDISAIDGSSVQPR